MEALIRDKLVDKVFLDIKAPFSRPDMYSMITGSGSAAARAEETLRICSRVPLEVRTTLLRSMDAGMIKEIAAALGCDCTYVVQQGRPEHAHLDEKPLTRDELMAAVSGLTGDIRIKTRE
ncbi:MAG TPA: hypothetical protein HA257_04535, partial [Candidatus Methanoperedenaceae archaeon]|nr:hypothetical protein [Candidatus Methanoperedenaceae archaeon]